MHVVWALIFYSIHEFLNETFPLQSIQLFQLLGLHFFFFSSSCNSNILSSQDRSSRRQNLQWAHSSLPSTKFFHALLMQHNTKNKSIRSSHEVDLLMWVQMLFITILFGRIIEKSLIPYSRASTIGVKLHTKR